MPVAATPNDPLFGLSWHLLNTGQGGGTAGVDLRILPAWQHVSGRGVLVAVMDDGVEASHPDLAANMWTRPAGAPIPSDASFATGLPVRNGLGRLGDNHGTAVAGVIAETGNNGIGSIGIAPDAKMVSYRVLGSGISGTQAFTQGIADGVAVFNGSFGMDNGLVADPDAGAYAIFATQGRGGLGSLFVKSNGNERAEAGAPSMADGGAEYANASRFTIAVAAVDNRGIVSDYSNPGGNLFISGFAGPGDDELQAGNSVATTDRAGIANGYNGNVSAHGGDYTGFNGTSAAAPVVSGVVALVLEANAQLGYRDVMDVLAYSARLTDAQAGTAGHATMGRTPWQTNGATNSNGGGLHFSHDYGFGLADAGAAVRLAEAWTTTPARTESNVLLTSANSAGATGSQVLAGGTYTTSFLLTQPPGAIPGYRVNRVELTLDLDSARPSDLTVALTSPTGTTIRLLTTTGNAFQGADGGGLDYAVPNPWAGPLMLGSPAFLGETAIGTWQLVVGAKAGADPNAVSAIFKTAALTVAGDALTSADLRLTQIFTDDFTTMATVQAGRTTLGGNGETTLNLAPMSAASIIDLSKTGASSIGGTAVTFADGAPLHMLKGGAGNDVFTGSLQADTLEGGWGRDVLQGFGGDDLLRGGADNDILIGNAGSDRLEGGAGRDAAFLAGTKGSVTVQRQADGTVKILSAAEGVDTLKSVEQLVFSDGVMNVGPLRAKDFSGQGFGDLMTRDASGALKMVMLKGNAVQGSTLFPAVDAAAALETTGDQNGDGFADMSFRKADGTWIFAYGQGTAAPVVNNLGVLDTAWHFTGMPDLDGDGMGDLLLRHDNGFLAALPTKAGGAALITYGAGVTGAADPGGAPVGLAAGWSLAAGADFTGDGKADLLLRDAADNLLLLVMDGTVATAVGQLGFGVSGGVILGTGDFDGDGKADLATRNAATGQVGVVLMEGVAVKSAMNLDGPAAGWNAFAVADYSGDDKADILWQRADGSLMLWEMNGTSLAWSGNVAPVEAGWTLIA